MDNTPQAKPAPQENGFLNIIFNILVPILILNHLTAKIGALSALGLALAFPVTYGIYDGIKRKKTNFFSLLGLFNTLLTGGLAVLGVGGIWFSIKEAAFPLLIGIFVLASAFSERPFIKTLFVNPQIVNTHLLMEKLKEKNKEHDFFVLMKKSTIWLSFSFFLSALLNFVLAQMIFVPTEMGLDSNAQSAALNMQIAEMTKWSMIVILIPSMAFLMSIIWLMLKSLSRMSGLHIDQILPLK